MSAALIAFGSVLAVVSFQALQQRYGRPSWSDLAGPAFLVAAVTIYAGVLLFLEGR